MIELHFRLRMTTIYCMTLTFSWGLASVAQAQNWPMVERFEGIPKNCSELCERQNELFRSVDVFTPKEKYRELFGAPFKSVRSGRFVIDWYAGELTDVFFISDNPTRYEAIAIMARGTDGDKSKIATPMGKLDELTLKDAIDWDLADLQEEGPRDDAVHFGNGHEMIDFSPLMSRAKYSDYHQFSLLFPVADCDKVNDDDSKFSEWKCGEQGSYGALGAFWMLQTQDKIGRDKSTALLQYFSRYYLWGLTEAPKN